MIKTFPTRTAASLVLCCALILAACSQTNDGATPKTSSSNNEASSTSSASDLGPQELDDEADSAKTDSQTDSQSVEDSNELPGQLAILDGNELYVARPDGQNLQLLDGSQRNTITEPTWSENGDQLAWVSAQQRSNNISIQRFAEDGTVEAPPQFREMGRGPLGYLQWSATLAASTNVESQSGNAEQENSLPEGGEAPEVGVDLSKLAYLQVSAGRQFELGAVAVVDEIFEPTIVHRSEPLFFSWSPDTTKVVVFDNFDTLTVFEIGSQTGQVAQLWSEKVAANFRAPAWLDDETIMFVDKGFLTTVRFDDNSQGAVIAQHRVPASSRFVLSPDRTSVAYRADVEIEPELSTISFGAPELAQAELGQAGELMVLDLVEGTKTKIDQGSILAWEWSPDSSSLAWVKQESFVGLRFSARWHFWSNNSDATIEAGRTPGVITKSQRVALPAIMTQKILPFFDQYVYSVTGWSPDSSAFAYSGQRSGAQGIWIQKLELAPTGPETDQKENSLGSDGAGQALVDSVRIAEGDFVTWGDGPTPPPQGGGTSVV